jgi:hypothetical protein
VTQNSDPNAGPQGGAGADLDLLGDPRSEYRDPRGRKKLKVSNDLRERVAVLSAGGMERTEIAEAIGCCEKTLRTYFLPQLNEGKSVKRAEAIEKLFALGIGGSVPALKAFLALGVKADAMPRATRPPKLGKKEQLLADAHTAHEGSAWGDILH